MRFDKLEFGSPDEKRPRQAGRSEVKKDQQYWAKAADTHRRAGNHENALRFYSRALEMDKTLVAAWVGQVQMLVQLGEYPQASLWGKKALELFPSQAGLLAGQAQAECRLGNMKQAHALSDQALRQRGESAYGWQVRGELMLAGRESTDRHCFDKAQIADPDWLVPLETALIYVHYKAFSRAQLRAQQAVEKAAGSPYAWYVLGLCQVRAGIESSARNSFQRCLELSPQHVEANARLAELRQSSAPFSRIFRRLWGGR